MFNKLGYQKKEDSIDRIQYIKKNKDTEIDRIGILKTKYIEFYKTTKEILIYNTYKHRDGSITQSDSGILNIDEFNSIEIQILELKW